MRFNRNTALIRKFHHEKDPQDLVMHTYVQCRAVVATERLNKSVLFQIRTLSVNFVISAAL